MAVDHENQGPTNGVTPHLTIPSRGGQAALEFYARAFGAEVLRGDLRAGEVLTGRDGIVMALLRLDRLDGDLNVDGRPVHVRRPEWMPDA